MTCIFLHSMSDTLLLISQSFLLSILNSWWPYITGFQSHHLDAEGLLRCEEGYLSTVKIFSCIAFFSACKPCLDGRDGRGGGCYYTADLGVRTKCLQLCCSPPFAKQKGDYKWIHSVRSSVCLPTTLWYPDDNLRTPDLINLKVDKTIIGSIPRSLFVFRADKKPRWSSQPETSICATFGFCMKCEGCLHGCRSIGFPWVQ